MIKRSVIRAKFSRSHYHATPDELAGIDRGLSDAAEGKFASAEDVDALFAKYRRKSVVHGQE